MSSVGSLFLFLVALGQVTVDQIDGTQLTGDWIGTGENSILLDFDGVSQSITLDQVSQIERTDVTVESTEPTFVGLSDGSILRVREISLNNDIAAMRLAGYGGDDAEVKVSISAIHWIRFRAPRLEPINEQWNQLVGVQHPSDILVVRASGDRLDQAPGTISAIAAESVKFNLGGQDVDAPRDRLEGLVFRQSSDDLPKCAAQITDAAGSIWCAKTLTGKGMHLSFQTPSGISRTIALESIHRVELQGNTQLIRLKDAVEVSFQPFVNGLLNTKYARELFGPRDVDEGLLLTGRSSLTVRIEDGFQQFETTIDAVNQTGSSGEQEIQFLFDGKVALTKRLTAKDLPLAIKLPINGQRRLQVQLQPSDDGVTGDAVLLRHPRIRK